MATNAELERRIADLERIVIEQKQALVALALAARNARYLSPAQTALLQKVLG